MTSNNEEIQKTKISGELWLNDKRVNDLFDEESGSTMEIKNIKNKGEGARLPYDYDHGYNEATQYDYTYFNGYYYSVEEKVMNEQNGEYVYKRVMEKSKDGQTEWINVLNEDDVNSITDDYPSLNVDYSFQSVLANTTSIIAFNVNKSYTYSTNSDSTYTYNIGILVSNDGNSWNKVLLHSFTSNTSTDKNVTIIRCVNNLDYFVLILDIEGIGQIIKYSLDGRVWSEKIVNDLNAFNVYNYESKQYSLFECYNDGVFNKGVLNSETENINGEICESVSVYYCNLDSNGIPDSSFSQVDTSSLTQNYFGYESYSTGIYYDTSIGAWVIGVWTNETEEWNEDEEDYVIIPANIKFYSTNDFVNWSMIATANEGTPSLFYIKNGMKYLGYYDGWCTINESDDYKNWYYVGGIRGPDDATGQNIIYKIVHNNIYIGAYDYKIAIAIKSTCDRSSVNEIIFESVFPLGCEYSSINHETPSDIYDLNYEWKLISMLNNSSGRVYTFQRVK